MKNKTRSHMKSSQHWFYRILSVLVAIGMLPSMLVVGNLNAFADESEGGVTVGNSDSDSSDGDGASDGDVDLVETESSSEASEPSSEATEPSGEAAEPSGEASEPSDDASEPSDDASEPSSEAAEPSGETSEPSSETLEPSSEASEPSDTAPASESTGLGVGGTSFPIPPVENEPDYSDILERIDQYSDLFDGMDEEDLLDLIGALSTPNLSVGALAILNGASISSDDLRDVAIESFLAVLSDDFNDDPSGYSDWNELIADAKDGISGHFLLSGLKDDWISENGKWDYAYAQAKLDSGSLLTETLKAWDAALSKGNAPAYYELSAEETTLLKTAVAGALNKLSAGIESVIETLEAIPAIADIRSGEGGKIVTTISVSGLEHSSLDGLLSVRYKIPAGIDTKGITVEGVNADLALGGKDSPDPNTIDPLDPYSYVWVTIKTMRQGEGLTFYLVIGKLTESGVTPTGTPVEIEAQLFYSGEPLDDFRETPTFHVIADRFGWGAVTTTAKVGTVSKDTVDTKDIDALPGNETAITLGSFGFSYSVSAKKFDTNYGLVFTSQIVIEDTFTVPTNTNGKLMLFITEDMIRSGNSSYNLELLDKQYDENDPTGYLTSFTVRLTSTVPSPQIKETTLTAPSFTITGAKIPRDAILFAAAAKSYTFSLASQKMSTGSAFGSVTPLVEYLDGTEPTTAPLSLLGQSKQMKFTVYQDYEDGSESMAMPFEKAITKISSIGYEGNRDNKHAFADDLVTFRLQGFKNMQKTPMQAMTLTDDGFDNTQMYPVSIYTGKYIYASDADYTITVTSGGASFAYTANPLTDATIELKDAIPNGAAAAMTPEQIKAITSIAFHFGAVPAGFTQAAEVCAPSITYAVNDGLQSDEVIANTATLSYKFGDQDFSVTKSDQLQFVTVPNFPISEGKTFTNLTQGAKTTPKDGDLLLFEITLTNPTTNKTYYGIDITDQHSANLTPHSGAYAPKTGASVGADTSGRSHMTLAKLRGNSPPDQSLIGNVDLSVPGTISIQLKDGAYLDPGNSLTLTYVMRYNAVEGEAFFHNEYEAVAYSYDYRNSRDPKPGDGGWTPPGPAPVKEKVLFFGGRLGQEVNSKSGQPYAKVAKDRPTALNPSVNLNRLYHGEKVTFTVTVESDRQYYAQYPLILENIVDDLPTYLALADNPNISLLITRADGSPSSNPSVTYAGAGKRIVFETGAITLGMGDTAVLTFTCVVNVTGATQELSKQTNTAYAMFQNEYGQYSASPVNASDTGDFDGNPDTKSRVKTTADVTVAANFNYAVGIAKSYKSSLYTPVGGSVTTGTASFALPVNSLESAYRRYAVEVRNYGDQAVTIPAIYDQLPSYETIDEEKPIEVYTFNATSKEIKAYTASYAQAPVSGVVMFSQWKDTTGADVNLLIPSYANRAEAGKDHTRVVLYYWTRVDVAAATAKMLGDGVSSKTLPNIAAIYVMDALGTGYITPVLKAGSTQTETAGNGWNGRTDTNRRYYASCNVTNTLALPIPMVNIRAQTIKSTVAGSTYKDYEESDIIAPEQAVGWKITYGNSKSSKQLEKGARLVVELPVGVRYLELKDNVLPGNLAPNPPEKQYPDGAGGREILIWTLNAPILASSAGALSEFTITTTTGSEYTSYVASAYLIPLETDLFQSGDVTASAEYTKQNPTGTGKLYRYGPENANTLNGILGKAHQNSLHYVASTDTVNVFGSIGASSRLEVFEVGYTDNKVDSFTPGMPEKIITLHHPGNTFTYTMVLNNSGTSPYNNLVLLGRLPSKGDISTRAKNESNSVTQRKSTVDARLADDAFTVWIENASGAKSPLASSQYEVQVLRNDKNRIFGDSDFSGANNGNWIPLDGSVPLDEIAAIRVVVTDPSVKLEPKQSLKVSYNAKFSGYETVSQVARNSFSFYFKCAISAGATVAVYAEPPMVSVKAKFDLNVNIEKTLLVDGTGEPKDKTFAFRLIGSRDSDDPRDLWANDPNALDYVSELFPVTVEKDDASGEWVGSLSVSNNAVNFANVYDTSLIYGLHYAIVEVPTNDLIGIYSPAYDSKSSSANSDSATVNLDFSAENTPTGEHKNNPTYYLNLEKVLIAHPGDTRQGAFEFDIVGRVGDHIVYRNDRLPIQTGDNEIEIKFNRPIKDPRDVVFEITERGVRYDMELEDLGLTEDETLDAWIWTWSFRATNTYRGEPDQFAFSFTKNLQLTGSDEAAPDTAFTFDIMAVYEGNTVYTDTVTLNLQKSPGNDKVWTDTIQKSISFDRKVSYEKVVFTITERDAGLSTAYSFVYSGGASKNGDTATWTFTGENTYEAPPDNPGENPEENPGDNPEDNSRDDSGDDDSRDYTPGDRGTSSSTTTIPNYPVPLAPPPLTILDDEVPLGRLPTTGGVMALSFRQKGGLFAILAMIIGLFRMLFSKDDSEK